MCFGAASLNSEKKGKIIGIKINQIAIPTLYILDFAEIIAFYVTYVLRNPNGNVRLHLIALNVHLTQHLVSSCELAAESSVKAG